MGHSDAIASFALCPPHPWLLFDMHFSCDSGYNLLDGNHFVFWQSIQTKIVGILHPLFISPLSWLRRFWTGCNWAPDHFSLQVGGRPGVFLSTTVVISFLIPPSPRRVLNERCIGFIFLLQDHNMMFCFKTKGPMSKNTEISKQQTQKTETTNKRVKWTMFENKRFI